MVGMTNLTELSKAMRISKTFANVGTLTSKNYIYKRSVKQVSNTAR